MIEITQFLSDQGITAGNTASFNEFQFFNGITVNDEVVYNKYDFYKYATVDGVVYNNEFDFFQAVCDFYSITEGNTKYHLYKNLVNDGEPVNYQYEFYQQAGPLIGQGSQTGGIATISIPADGGTIYEPQNCGGAAVGALSLSTTGTFNNNGMECTTGSGTGAVLRYSVDGSKNLYGATITTAGDGYAVGDIVFFVQYRTNIHGGSNWFKVAGEVTAIV